MTKSKTSIIWTIALIAVPLGIIIAASLGNTLGLKMSESYSVFSFLWEDSKIESSAGSIEVKELEGGIATSTDSEDSSLAFSVVIGEVSAYTSSPDETSGDPCISASGDNICELFYDYISVGLEIMACPEKYEFSTRVSFVGGTIDGMFGNWAYERHFICLDRMNKRYRDGNYFDIYFGMDKQGALDWGRRKNVEIKIYEN